MNDERVIQGILNVQADNISRMILDPNGRYPVCVPGVGTGICEYCGNDVDSTWGKACPSAPYSQRWSDRCE